MFLSLYPLGRTCSAITRMTNHVPDCFTGFQCLSSSEDSDPTQTDHKKRKTIMAKKWNSIRSSATKVLIEGFGFPVGVCCNNCGESTMLNVCNVVHFRSTVRHVQSKHIKLLCIIICSKFGRLLQTQNS